MSDINPLLGIVSPLYFRPDLPYGKLYTYESGTNTPLPVFQDSSGLVQHPNPVILDENGVAILFCLNQKYRFVLKDSTDVTQVGYPLDDVGPIDYSADILQLTSDLETLEGDIDVLQASLAAVESDLDSLDSSLELKAEEDHTHVKSDITDLGGDEPLALGSFISMKVDIPARQESFIDFIGSSTTILKNSGMDSIFITRTNDGIEVKNACSVILHAYPYHSSAFKVDGSEISSVLTLYYNSVDELNSKLSLSGPSAFSGFKIGTVALHLLTGDKIQLKPQTHPNVSQAYYISLTIVPAVTT